MEVDKNIEVNSRRAQSVIGDFISFAIPCLIFMEIKMVGRLFVSEIVLMVLLIFLFVIRGRMLFNKLPRTFIIFGLFWLFSQVATDVFRSSTFEDYARGWSKIVFLLLNFSAIYLLLHSKKRRIVLFAVGIAMGQILQFFITPNIYAVQGYVWKFGVGYALTLLLIIGTQWKKIARIPFLSEIIIGGAAILNYFLDFRSLGVFCSFTLLYLFYQRAYKRRKKPIKSVSTFKALLAAIFLGIFSIVIIWSFYGFAANEGWFGEDAKQKYESQASGKYGFLLGGRPELFVSSMAIIDSPIIGHGSWAKSPNYAMLLIEQLSEYGYEARGPQRDHDTIPTHSYLLGAWVESGILGAIFWFWVLMLAIKLLIAMRRFKTGLTILLAFVSFGMIWNILFSPLGAEGRLYAAYYIVLLIYGTILAKSTKTVIQSTLTKNYS